MKLEEDIKFAVKSIAILIAVASLLGFIISGFNIKIVMYFLIFTAIMILVEVTIGELLFRYKWKRWTWS